MENKLVCFDVDGTLTKENSWYTLNVALGMAPERDAELYEQYVNGYITYQQWVDAIVGSYVHADTPHVEIVDSLFTKVQLNPYAKEVVTALNECGYTVVLISGSFDEYVQKVARTLGIAHYQACSHLVFDEHGYVSCIAHSGDEHSAKAAYLQTFAEQFNVDIQSCICIGDGANDRDMFRITGKGITFTGSPIESDAWQVVDRLEEVLTVLL